MQLGFTFGQVPDSAYDRLMVAKDQGMRAMQSVADNSGPEFQQRAYEFCVSFFRGQQVAKSSEDATEAMIAAGIVPKDKRAMGAVIMKLLKNNMIQYAGACSRRFGHGSRGGSLYLAVA